MKIKPISATVIDSVWKDVYEGRTEKGHAIAVPVDFCIAKRSNVLSVGI